MINMLLLVLASGSLTASAQEQRALSLQDCIDYAIKNAAAAKNARLDIELQKAQNAEVTGRALPQISAEGQYSRFIDVQQTFLPSTFLDPAAPFEWIPFGFSPKQSTIGSVKASQMLFNGSLFVALQARNTLITLARQQADMKIEDLRYNIQKAYAAMVIANKQFALMKSSLELVRNNRNDLKIMYDNGVIEKLEVDRMEVQLSNLESDSTGLYNMIVVSEQMLKYTIGMDLNTPIK
jgi:outer membrane protein